MFIYYKMKIYSLISGIILTSVFAGASPLMAQQDSTMNQSMRLERDFSPIVQQKNKIDRQPATQPLREKKSDASYANWSVESVKSSEIGIVPAGQVIAQEENEDYSGYIQLSAGNYWNTELKAGAKLGDLSIDATGFYTSGNLKLPHPVSTSEGYENKRWDSRLLTGSLIGTYSTTLISDAQFETHVKAAGTSVNTFNYQFLQDIYTDTLLMRSAKPSSQHWGQIGADVSYETDQMKLFLQYDYTKLSTPDSFPCNWVTNTLLFKGSYGWYDNDSWQFSVDLDMGAVFGKDKSYFIFHPELHYSLMPSYGEWRRAYMNLGFGSRRESLMEIMNTMPLAHFDEEYKNSVDIFDLTIGYEDNEQGYLHWGAEVELGLTKDKLCAVASPIDTTNRDGIYMKILQDDCFAYGFGAHADYEYNRFFGAKAKAHFQGLSCEAASLAKPHIEMALHLLSNPGKVKLDLGMDFGFCRKMQYLDHEYDLGSIADMNFRADWEINEQLNVFAFARNILNIKYELWPAVPAQGLNFHVGFNWVF